MAAKRFRVLILGYGEIGHAIGHLLGARHELTVWQRRPGAGMPVVDPLRAAVASDFVFFCVPCQAHFALASRLQPALTPKTVCVTIAKGLDDAGRLAIEVFREVLPNVPAGVLYGPMIAEEVCAAKPAFAQFASDNAACTDRALRLFEHSELSIEATSDPVGVSWLAVLKNVYAMLFGIADEWGLGDNTRGFLTVAAMREMQHIVFDRTGTEPRPHELAGLGDLVTTGTSAGSHHRELGRRLARGEHQGLEGEGVHTLAMIRRLGLVDLSRYPLCRLLDTALQQQTVLSRAMFETYLRSPLLLFTPRDAGR